MRVRPTPNDDMLRMLVNLQDDACDGFVYSLHLVGIVLLIGADDEILDHDLALYQVATFFAFWGLL